MSVCLDPKAYINSGNMGTRAKGPMPGTKVAAVAHVKVENFQKVLQFSGSLGSSEGCGTSTRYELALDLTK